METESTNVPSMVTLQEVLAGLMWASQTRPTRKLFEEIDEKARKSGGAKALAALYRRLDGCTVENGLSARILFLEEHYLWKPDPKDKNCFFPVPAIQDAVAELDRLREKLQEYEEEFHSELNADESRITVSTSPTGVSRYSSHTVALWAREQLGITIAEWDDFGDFNLYEDGLSKASWITEAIQEAHLQVLEALLNAALPLELPEGSDRIPPNGLRLRFKKDKNPHDREIINVEGFRAFINWQFSRITRDSDRQLLTRDATWQVLKTWKLKFPLSSRKLEPYSSANQRCVRLMIAGLLTGLAPDSFADELRSKGPLKWQLPSTLENVDLNCIQGVHPQTARRIVQTCVDGLLKKSQAASGA